MKSHNSFPLFILFSALGLTSIAAYFSIVGISSLFLGASISVGILALFLEIGKICSVSFAYRYWNDCKLYLKIYLIISIFILMTITSLGVFGYLSAAFQKSSIEFNVVQEKISSIQDQKVFYNNKIDTSKKRINELTLLRTSEESRMSQIITNEYISRNPVQLKQLQQQNIELIDDTESDIKTENTRIQDSIDNISKMDSQINDLKMNTSGKKDIQTFKFVADALKLPLDIVARWFILSIICVFDPLAICLILAYNVVVCKKEVPLNIITDKSDPLKDKETPLLKNELSNEINSNVSPSEVIASPTSTVPPTPTSNKSEMSHFFKQMFKLD